MRAVVQSVGIPFPTIFVSYGKLTYNTPSSLIIKNDSVLLILDGYDFWERHIILLF